MDWPRRRRRRCSPARADAFGRRRRGAAGAHDQPREHGRRAQGRHPSSRPGTGGVRRGTPRHDARRKRWASAASSCCSWPRSRAPRSCWRRSACTPRSATTSRSASARSASASRSARSHPGFAVSSSGARCCWRGPASRAGACASLALTRLIRGLLFEVAPGDVTTLVATAGALALVALAASYAPARRIARTDPAIALRQE